MFDDSIPKIIQMSNLNWREREQEKAFVSFITLFKNALGKQKGEIPTREKCRNFFGLY